MNASSDHVDAGSTAGTNALADGAEARRLEEVRARTAHWKRWGPYLSERAWGTVREDYSADGDAWTFLPHDHARSKAYRWNEDGIAGFCDRHQRICLALALWNERDPILKERLFGVGGHEGNHGEDAKEYWFHLDSTPTHSYLKCLYKYPQAAFPYAQLLAESARRGKLDAEYELLDTGVFDEGRYFDVLVEYAKATPEDVLVRITATNRGPEPAPLHLLPTIWFRNTWSWGDGSERPRARALSPAVESAEPPAADAPRDMRAGTNGGPVPSQVVELEEPTYGLRWLHVEGYPALLFTENETNRRRLYGQPDPAPYVKDGIDAFVVRGELEAVNPERVGTKLAAHHRLVLQPGESATVRLRLTDRPLASRAGRTSTAPAAADAEEPFGGAFEATFATRIREADEFYSGVIPAGLSEDARGVMRQALGGLLWTKQFYHYVVETWLDGDRGQPPPPAQRRSGRNATWTHLYNADVLSVPDKWEFPWYAAWDLAFQCVPLALVDPDFAKEQLLLLTREWYMHPNGQLPAYEWSLGDVNPPVHAWAAWRVYKIEKKRRGEGDRRFLERVFHKLLLNFTWWVNRKDAEDRNVFQGGFLGLDNIGVFDRSARLPTGGHLEQSDATSWMAMYTLNLLAIALELARENPAYEDVASKFWEHFVYIAHAMNHLGHAELSLWDDEDGFYYDVVHFPDGRHQPLKVRSVVGLIPLLAVETLEPELLAALPSFARRMRWFLEHRPDLTGNVACMRTPGRGERRLLSIVDPVRLRRVLARMLDDDEFLSAYGIRSLSRAHGERPYVVRVNGTEHRVDYEPAESRTGMFGGNSNWRGPVWFPLNYLLIEALQKFHHYLGPAFQVPFPASAPTRLTLREVAAELSRRLSRIFLRGPDGRRPVYGTREIPQSDPHWRDLVLFHEYFHGDFGTGLGASHQTGWTALVAKLLQQSGE